MQYILESQQCLLDMFTSAVNWEIHPYCTLAQVGGRSSSVPSHPSSLQVLQGIVDIHN